MAEKDDRARGPSWWEVGAVLGVSATIFSVAGSFIQVETEWLKLWDMAAAALAIGLAATAYLWRRRLRRWIPEHRHGHAAAGFLTGLVALFVLLLFIGPKAFPADTHDRSEQEVWASREDNVSVPLPAHKGWAMTDFPVKLAYLRSVEVAAAPENARLVLNVYDANQNVVASGEAVVVNWRAKVVFDPPRDIAHFVGSRLYLSVDNIFGQDARVYFTKDDEAPGYTSYLPCPRTRRLDCPNPYDRDLMVLVIGRRSG
ncbi:hypothetical protein [Actinoplanes sp. NPDC051411]|uniref:hypothetical protein n=1 Tax=Actinoplanes sp. NPDC051411 TaxID=3155522 RepID=UPI00341C0093